LSASADFNDGIDVPRVFGLPPEIADRHRRLVVDDLVAAVDELLAARQNPQLGHHPRLASWNRLVAARARLVSDGFAAV
jgi:hypothetical protein